MTEPRFDDAFGTALRHILVARVDASVAARKQRHRRMWLGAGVFAGAGLLGGIGATAAGVLVLPGGDAVTALAAPVVGTYTGTATVDLGQAPDGASNVAFELTCLTPGQFTFSDGASVVCSETDLGTRSAVTGHSLPLAAGQHTITIAAGGGQGWALKATYVVQAVTEWGVNAQGESYGVENVNGVPDLVAVVATNGKTGYARSADLNKAAGPDFKSPEEALAWQAARSGTRVAIPVYEPDGTTVVGEFVTGG